MGRWGRLNNMFRPALPVQGGEGGGGVGQLWTEQHVCLPVQGGEGGGGSRPAMG